MNNPRTTYFSRYLLFGVIFFLNGDAYSQVRTFEVKAYNHCLLQIQTPIQGNTLSLVYQTLPANQAGQNHNSLWLWRSSQVPWNSPPMKKQMLPANATQSGSYVLDDVSISIQTAYIACYSLDSTAKRICACSILSATGDSTQNESVDIQLLQVSSNSLMFQYVSLPGYLPEAYGNWFGVWKGNASPYNLYPALATGTPVDNSNVSTGALNGIQFEPNQTYTLIYFLGKATTTAAAIITFVVK